MKQNPKETVATFLGSEFTRRKHRNKSYSLRAFARDLSVSPSRLSELLSGKHGVSEKTADLIAERLGLSAKQRTQWKDLILAHHGRSQKIRELANERLDQHKQQDSVLDLQEEKFRFISDWFHGAILELTELPYFRSDFEWIAKRLGISSDQASEAIERLIKLGLLHWEKNVLKATPDAHFTSADVPSSAIRKFHRQVLGMHIESLLQDPVTEREFNSIIVALPAEAVAEFGNEMRRFMMSFWEKYRNAPKTELYSLSMQICPVKNRRRGEN